MSIEYIHLPLPCGETGKFAGEELRNFLGRCRMKRNIAISMQLNSALGRDEFLLSGCGSYTITGGTETALLYGAYELLKQFGFRFFGPDSWDTVIPEAEIDPPETLVHFQPAFELRGFFAVEKRDTEDFLLWMARNYLNFWTHDVNHPELCRKLGIKLRGNPPSGMHRLFEDYLSPSEYEEKHPEYYALCQGKRISLMGPSNAWNICMSNPDAATQLAENLCTALNPGGKLEQVSALTFAPFDNGHWCECEKCLAQGNRTTRLLRLADHCSRLIREKVKRPVQLIVPAYHETLPPPDMALPENFDYERIAIEFFPIERCYAHTIDDPSCPANVLMKKCYDAWATLKKFRLFVCEYYNVSTFASAAFVFDDTLPHDLAFYRKNGSRYINYMHVSTALWGELALNNCSFAEEIAGKSFSPEDFLEKRYGAAATVMRDFYALLRRFSHLSKPLFHYVGKGKMLPDGSNTEKFSFEQALRCQGNGENYPFFLPGHFEEHESSPLIPSLDETLKLLDEMEELLKKADPAGNNRVQKCLETDRMRFTYTVKRARFMIALLHLFQAEKSGKSEKALSLAAELRGYGEAMRNDTVSVAHIRAAGAPNLKLYVNALTATRLQKLYAEKMMQYHLEVMPFSKDEGFTVHQG